MGEQLPLMPYGDIPGHVRGSDTSTATAASLNSRALAQLQQKVFDFIRRKERFGATDEEIRIAFLKATLSPLVGETIDANLLQIITELAVSTNRHQSLTARRRELVLGRRIVDSGRRRKTLANKPAVVWVTPNHVCMDPENCGKDGYQCGCMKGTD